MDNREKKQLKAICENVAVFSPAAFILLSAFFPETAMAILVWGVMILFAGFLLLPVIYTLLYILNELFVLK